MTVSDNGVDCMSIIGLLYTQSFNRIIRKTSCQVKSNTQY
jgi:hypothetical protein